MNNTKDKNEIVAVKCEGVFTEWYSPFYKEPYDTNEEYRKYYDEVILLEKPMIGPAIGDNDEDFITDDLQCHAERAVTDSDDWEKAIEDYKATVLMCLADGKPRTFEFKGVTPIKITPVKRGDMPPVNEKGLEVYGPFKDLAREAVEAI